MIVLVSLSLFLLVSVSGQEDIGPARETRDAGCESDQHRCISTGRCVYGWYRCDGLLSCEDGSDEDKSMCETAQPWRCLKSPDLCFQGLKTSTHTCSIWQHRCGTTNICLSYYSLCDLDSNCDDDSDEDEDMCASRSCELSEYRCGTGQCVYYLFVCDGFENCADGSDEAEDGGCTNETTPDYGTNTTVRVVTNGDNSTTFKQTNATENLTDENVTTPGLSDVDTTVVNTTLDYKPKNPNSIGTQANNSTMTRQTQNTTQTNGIGKNTDATTTAPWRQDVDTTKADSSAGKNLAHRVVKYNYLMFIIVLNFN